MNVTKYRVVVHSIDMYGCSLYRLEKRICLFIYTKWIQVDKETKCILTSSDKDSLLNFAKRLK